MNIKITTEELEKIITRSVNIGRADMIRAFLPSGTEMSRPQLLNYLKIQGYKPMDLQSWEDHGLLKFRQTKKNNTKKYRIIDVEKVLLLSEISNARFNE